MLVERQLSTANRRVTPDEIDRLREVILPKLRCDKAMRAATGLVTFNGSNYNDADGIGSVSDVAIGSAGGLSGITADVAGFLAGVFETATGPIGGAPATLAFGASGMGMSFSMLSPMLNQVFFIGDGLTGDQIGASQTFYVPTGATSLLLGFADAGGYALVSASLAVHVHIAASRSVRACLH